MRGEASARMGERERERERAIAFGREMPFEWPMEMRVEEEAANVYCSLSL